LSPAVAAAALLPFSVCCILLVWWQEGIGRSGKFSWVTLSVGVRFQVLRGSRGRRVGQGNLDNVW
jgi:hypothetical protein